MKLFKTIIFVLSVHFFFACSDNPSSSSDSKGVEGTMTDSRDGQVYKTVEIAGKTWMAENLRFSYNDESKNQCYAYDDEEGTQCRLYGQLYTHQAALSACPEGWHLSTLKEWWSVMDFAFSISDLTLADGWAKTEIEWKNTYKFGLVAAGALEDEGSGYPVSKGRDYYAFFWTPQEVGRGNSAVNTFYFHLHTADEIKGTSASVEYGEDMITKEPVFFSVRCVKND